MKICSRCGAEGPFYRKRTEKDGLDYLCRACRIESTMASQRKRIAQGTCRECSELRINRTHCARHTRMHAEDTHRWDYKVRQATKVSLPKTDSSEEIVG